MHLEPPDSIIANSLSDFIRFSAVIASFPTSRDQYPTRTMNRVVEVTSDLPQCWQNRLLPSSYPTYPTYTTYKSYNSQ
jgi:hypothetical protein